MSLGWLNRDWSGEGIDRRTCSKGGMCPFVWSDRRRNMIRDGLGNVKVGGKDRWRQRMQNDLCNHCMVQPYIPHVSEFRLCTYALEEVNQVKGETLKVSYRLPLNITTTSAQLCGLACLSGSRSLITIRSLWTHLSITPYIQFCSCSPQSMHSSSLRTWIVYVLRILYRAPAAKQGKRHKNRITL